MSSKPGSSSPSNSSVSRNHTHHGRSRSRSRSRDQARHRHQAHANQINTKERSQRRRERSQSPPPSSSSVSAETPSLKSKVDGDDDRKVDDRKVEYKFDKAPTNEAPTNANTRKEQGPNMALSEKKKQGDIVVNVTAYYPNRGTYDTIQMTVQSDDTIDDIYNFLKSITGCDHECNEFYIDVYSNLRKSLASYDAVVSISKLGITNGSCITFLRSLILVEDEEEDETPTRDGEGDDGEHGDGEDGYKTEK